MRQVLKNKAVVGSAIEASELRKSQAILDEVAEIRGICEQFLAKHELENGPEPQPNDQTNQVKYQKLKKWLLKFFEKALEQEKQA